jgi:hypothetical protein
LGEDKVPTVTAGACRPRQAKNESVFRLSGQGTGLQRADANRPQAGIVEYDSEAVHGTTQKGKNGLRCDIARREAGSARCQDDVNKIGRYPGS